MHYGVSLFPQYTTWDALAEMGKAVDGWGYDSLWTWDHFMPIIGDPQGPNLEGWQILAAWAALTKRVKLGALVTGNTYRHPAVLAKMAATLDHISHGRAILGMGAAWYELEHNQYGIDFGASPGERLARLGEALPIVRSLLDNRLTTLEGKFYRVQEAMAEPKPVQKHLPIMIGGGGEQKTLRLVARYADYWNGFGTPEEVGRKLSILKSHCDEAGTRFDDILTTVLMRLVVTDSPAEVERRNRESDEANHVAAEFRNSGIATMGGTPDEVARLIHEYQQVGVKGIIIGMSSPFDGQTLQRIVEEVKPRVEDLAGARR